MPSAAVCRSLHHGRIMKCLAFLLLLPDSLKKPRHPACSRTVKPERMELRPAGGNAEPGQHEKKRSETATNSREGPAETTGTEQNNDNSINNNNVVNNSSSVQPTLRER